MTFTSQWTLPVPSYGYARVKGISALVTTFGVGELSAVNALAGAYSEHVPIVHIVGCPATPSQKDGALLHHTLGNGNFNLNDPGNIAAQIDNALQQCFIQSRPVYIMFPTDMVAKKVEGFRLETPIDMQYPINDPDKEEYVVGVVLKYLMRAKSPIILVDACAVRHRVLEEVHDLIEKTHLPTFVTPMGKGAIDETHNSYCGVYAGEGSQPKVKERVESTDLILTIGAIKNRIVRITMVVPDFNAGGFSYKTSQLNTIDFHSTHVAVRYSGYPCAHMRGVLRKIIENVDHKQLSLVPGPIAKNKFPDGESSVPTITQAWIWPKIGEFLKEKDIVVTETGTANFGILETKFPKAVTAISQGAALAARDMDEKRRTVLFVGDGSFQLTAQELSTIIRLNLKPIIFVICNEGYTIERFIHGFDAAYNDIATWSFKDLVKVFGAKEGTYKTYQIKTKEELEWLFGDEDFTVADTLQFVEIYIPKDDARRALKLTAEAAAAKNRS
ncbi:hypothetical protein HYFRA_00002996 [Hymenoscyphus fraxineus]|uniref:Pyruvate decarboxylase n=1 Tax=Hymenoscyphus fraxineus TaxID=746836 RepID=A0A9N9PL71_9HELO|nr:hypothetical protein HYFRA_00002996 [Hymenoscyphus fraxineus]